MKPLYTDSLEAKHSVFFKISLSPHCLSICHIDHQKSSTEAGCLELWISKYLNISNWIQNTVKSVSKWLSIDCETHDLIFIYSFIHYFCAKGHRYNPLFVTHSAGIWKDSSIAISKQMIQKLILFFHWEICWTQQSLTC